MGKMYQWLISSLGRRPLIFTILSGIICYLLSLTWLLAFLSMDFLANGLSVFGASLIIVCFHWFIAFHVRSSMLAQVLALVPAVFLVSLILFAMTQLKITQICVEDPVTGAIRDCRAVVD